MRWLTKTRVQYSLAGMGVVYLILFVGYLVYAGTKQPTQSGPSELEAHPERQQEILARQRAEEMQQRLNLSDEQTQKIAEIMQKNAPNPSPDGNFREQMRAAREEIATVLTAEQKAQMEQTRGQFGGPGGPRGPGGRMSPERMEALKDKMTPEQKARFEKKMESFGGGRRQQGGQGGGGRKRGPQQ